MAIPQNIFNGIAIKLGSLFDGIGGFPYSALRHGIVPVWASEIEPWPIKVTQKYFPDMKHLGDITQINGAEIEPVDIVTFGSPCQDLSVAGKREGLAGERSGLFMDAIRIIRQMRTATGGKYPRFAVWENVPGAFSSNKGQDFRAVLEEITESEIPMPASGKWANAGMVRTSGVDLAWKIFDAQYWGVPQRRKRIFLVADFGGQCAGEILFNEEGLRRDFTPCGSPWQGTTGNAKDSISASGFDGYNFAVDKNVTSTVGVNCGMSTGRNGVICLNDQGGSVMSVSKDITATLRAEEHGHQPCVLQASGFCTEHSAKSRGVGYEEEVSPTLRAGVVPGIVMSFEPGAASRTGGHTDENISGTLRASMGDNQIAVAIENHPTDSRVKLAEDNKVQTLTSRMGTGGGNVPMLMQPIVYSFDALSSNSMKSKNPISGCREVDKSKYLDTTFPCPSKNQGGIAICQPTEELSGTLQSKNNGGYSLNYQNPVRIGYAVRRLTPLECIRLQGFPDWWLDIDKMSDTQKYRAIGNSVAIPCVDFIMQRIAFILKGA